MRAIFIRHGQTDWNRKLMVQGRTDIPLNETGLRQAKAIAARLAGQQVCAVYAGPLARAFETGRQVAQACGCKITACPGFTEIDFGPWEGRTFDELRRNEPELWETWRTCPGQAVIKGAESLESILSRALNEMDCILKRHTQDETVAIATHTMPLKLLVAHYIGLPMDSLHRLRVDNCGYTMVDIGSEKCGVLCSLNDTSHLEAEGLL